MTDPRAFTPGEFDLLLAVLERCAVALETLAADVKLPEQVGRIAMPLVGVLHPPDESQFRAAGRKIVEGYQAVGRAMAEERGAEIKASLDADRAQERAAKVLEAPAARPVQPDASVEREARAQLGLEPVTVGGMAVLPPDPEVAKALAKADTSAMTDVVRELEAQESAKRLLGPKAYAALWGMHANEVLSPEAAGAVKAVSLRHLHPKDFDLAKELVGITPGKLPTAFQAKRLILECVVPEVGSAAKKEDAPWA